MITKLEQEIKEDLALFYDKPEEYKAKVNNLSKLFKLKDSLRGDFLPTYLVGNYINNNDKYVIMSINPGFAYNQNIAEENLKKGSIDKYFDFVKNFFNSIRDLTYINDKNESKKFSSQYYDTLMPYFNILLDSTEEDTLTLCNTHIINIDLIPYHSKSFNCNKHSVFKNKDLYDYTKNRFDNIMDFINHMTNVKGIIFNSALYEELLFNYLYKDKLDITSIEINKISNANLFTLDKFKCVQHNFVNHWSYPKIHEDTIKLAETYKNFLSR